MYKLSTTPNIIRLSDGACIPADPANNDYAEYLRWVGEGNAPEPADVPDPKQEALSKISGLESQTLLPRVTREFILGAVKAEAQKAGLDPMALPAYVKLKALDDQIIALRALL